MSGPASPGRPRRSLRRGVLLALVAVGFVGFAADAGRLSEPGTAAGAIGTVVPGQADAARPAPAQTPTSSPRDVYVVRMVPSGFRADPHMTVEAVRGAVDGASAYWSEQTRGAVSFRTVSVSEWVDTDIGCDDVAGLWSEAFEVVPAAAEHRAHLVVMAPQAAGAEGGPCDFGFGSIGEGDSGGSTYVTDLRPELLAHELGHNLGLGHAATLECAGKQDGRWDGAWESGCAARDYDDLYDVMGYSGEGFGGGHLNAVGIDRLGADPDGVRTVRESTAGVRLVPMARIGQGQRVLRIEAPGEPVYYAEYRTAEGRDEAIATGVWRPSTGLRILRADPENGSVELDASPGGWRYDRALGVGRTFTSASGAVSVSVTATDDDGVDVDVSIGPAVAPAPSVPTPVSGHRTPAPVGLPQ